MNPDGPSNEDLLLTALRGFVDELTTISGHGRMTWWHCLTTHTGRPRPLDCLDVTMLATLNGGDDARHDSRARIIDAKSKTPP